MNTNSDPTSTHRIHLRGPWQASSWNERVVLSRRFHTPTGLEPGDRLQLGFQLPAERSLAATYLNGTQLAISESENNFQADVRGILEQASKTALHQLEIHLTSSDNSDQQSDQEKAERFRPSEHSTLLIDAWLDLFSN